MEKFKIEIIPTDGICQPEKYTEKAEGFCEAQSKAWHHAVACYGTEFKLFINGEEI